MTFSIIVDSAANIPAEKVKEYDIEVISFVNYVNGEELVCFDPNLSPEEERNNGKKYYDAVRNGAEVKTSLVNSDTFEKEFAKHLEKGLDIIYICLSKNISGTFQAASIAREELLEKYPERKIEIIDSLNASLGEGLHAIKASELRKQGMEVEEIADVLRKDVPRMNGVFTVADLKYLSRSGRIHSAKALAGNVLNIKPILIGNGDGYIVEFSKIRGRKKSIERLIELVVNNVEEPENQILGVAHADAYEEAKYVADKVMSSCGFRDCIITSYDYCTGSHVGPETIAVFFLAKDRLLMGKAE